MLLALPSLFFSWEPSGRLPNSPHSSPTPRSVCCPPFNSLYINISPSPADSRPPPPASLLAGLPSPGFGWRSASQTTRALGLNVLHACQFFQEVVYMLGSHINELPWSSQWKVLLLLKNIRVLCCKWWVNPWPPIMTDNGQPNKTGLWLLRGVMAFLSRVTRQFQLPAYVSEIVCVFSRFSRLLLALPTCSPSCL